MKITRKHMRGALLIITFILFFEPLFFKEVPLLHGLSQIVTAVSMCVIVYKCYKRKNEINKISKLVIAYGVCIIVSSLLNKNLELSTIRTVLSIVGMMLFIDYYKYSKIRKPLFNSFFLLITINLFSKIIMNSVIESVVGLGRWFLSGSNSLIIYILPAVYLSLLCIDEKKNIVSSIVLIIMCIITAIMSDTATTIFTSIVFVGLWSVYKLFGHNILTIRQVVLIVFILFFVIVFFHIQNKINVIRFVVEELLQRDISFTTRTYIWVQSMEEIMKKPVLGHGFGYPFRVVVGIAGFMAEHAHNHILQQLLQGGMIQLILFFCILYQMIRVMAAVPTKKSVCGIMAFLILGIMFLFETYTNAMIYMIIFLNYSFCEEYLMNNPSKEFQIV